MSFALADVPSLPINSRTAAALGGHGLKGSENTCRGEKQFEYMITTEGFSKFLVGIGAVALIGSVIAFCVWGGLPLFRDTPIDSDKFDHFGSFVSGVVGTIWSLAGIILVYVALQEQRKDFKTNREALEAQLEALNQQIKEFELQREEMELTRNVFIEQSKTLKTQQFESTFFNTFDLLISLTNGITYKVTSITSGGSVREKQAAIYVGKECFALFYNIFSAKYNIISTSGRNALKKRITTPEGTFDKTRAVTLEMKLVWIKQAYEEFFLSKQALIGHYFRTLYNVIKFVKRQNPDDQKYYTNLVRSQLSTYEHVLLFYNCLSNYGEENFKPLVIEYSLLNNMPQEKLLDREHKGFYPDIAYE